MTTIKSITVALVSSLILGSLAFAHGTINERERRQQKRIADAIKDGELTRREAGKLEKQ